MIDGNILDLKTPAQDPLNELLKHGAQQLLAKAVEAELAELLDQHSDLRVEGRQAVVRNGYLPERTVQTGLGDLPVKVPKVRDRSGSGIKFNSSLVPPYLKRTKAMAYKLIVAAQKKWRRLRGYKLLADVIQGVKFKDGERVEPDRQQGHAEKAVHQI